MMLSPHKADIQLLHIVIDWGNTKTTNGDKENCSGPLEKINRFGWTREQKKVLLKSSRNQRRIPVSILTFVIQDVLMILKS